MDTDEDDLRDLKIVCSILKSRTMTTGGNFGKPCILVQRAALRAASLYCKMAAKFKIDGSVLTRDNFADVLIEIKYSTTLIPTAN